MVIDFKEMPQANSGGGLQDTFELFSRDFLEDLGLNILQHPDRGADGKKDLIVAETRNGVAGKTIIKWLVSCKHHAHSGKSVSDTDEPDILDRVAAHKCNGFIGVYSTLAATSLNGKLIGYNDKIEHQIFDRERIEKHLLNHPLGIKLARRYFPKSIEKFISENPKPASIFKEKPEIKCDYCSKDLLTTRNGIFVVLKENGSYKKDKLGLQYSEDKDIYYSCKGTCDTILENRYNQKGLVNAGWEDIDDLMIPTLFLKNIMAYMNQLNEQEVSKEAHEKMKQLYIRVFPHVARDLTEKEKARVKILSEFGL